jgi:quercetin dioxygenase-like cupin family protein
MASHPPHHHPNEEIFIVKEGQLDVSINGRHESAGPGGMVFIASNDVHNVTNVGPSLATYTVVSFHTSAERGVGDRPAAEWAPKAMLASRVIDPGKVASVATPIGFHSSLVDSPTLTFRTLESHLTTLGPGKGTAPRNRIPGDELFIVLQGTLRATLNGVSRTLGPGSLYYVASNDERTMSNPGTEPCTYQVIRVVSDRTPAPAAGRPS